MASFGLVVEGQTDYAVLKNILYGFSSDPDLFIKELQPLRDATDAPISQTFGGWFNVFEYCRSDNFKEALQETDDFIVIQIDTDRSDEKNYDVPKTDENGTVLSPSQLIDRVKLKFSQLFETAFGLNFWATYGHRILFAIAVDEIECWILPLYFTDKTKEATNNCLHKLNRQLSRNNEPTIREDKVGESNKYSQITKAYRKPKTLSEKQADNPSFNIFYNELTQKALR